MTGEIAAGQTTIDELTPATVVRIMTGALIPSGCTVVVPFEWTEEDDREVVYDVPGGGAALRRAGEEVTEGDLVMRAGV